MKFLDWEYYFSNFRVLNGFLNTGKGGTAYLGIIDNGKIRGISLTQFQVRPFRTFPYPKYFKFLCLLCAMVVESHQSEVQRTQF